MPVRLLTDAERERFTGFPKELPEEDLYAFFTLTGPDRAAIPGRSAPANRLGFAISLCAVRYLGFCPEDLAAVPKNAAFYVGQQLMVAAQALASYSEREQTRTDHLRKIYEHLGYRRLSTDHAREVFGWLVRRALEHDDAPLLVSLLAERLKQEKFVRPGVSRMERMVAAARERAGEETFRVLSPLLQQERTAALDALLVPDARLPGPPNRTRHSWLKEGATSNTPRAILGQLEKLSYLRGLCADKLDLSALNPNRVKFLAALGRRHTNQALQRLAPERRYPVLLAFLAESHAEITDEVIDLFDRLLAQTDARSRRDLDEFRKGSSRAVGEKVRLFRDLGAILLDPAVADPDVRSAALDRVGSAERGSRGWSRSPRGSFGRWRTTTTGSSSTITPASGASPRPSWRPSTSARAGRGKRSLRRWKCSMSLTRPAGGKCPRTARARSCRPSGSPTSWPGPGAWTAATGRRASVGAKTTAV